MVYCVSFFYVYDTQPRLQRESCSAASDVFKGQVRGFTRTEQRIEQRTEGIEVMHGEAGWARFLACTRVLILLAPRTPQTENLIDAQALQQMPAGGWLINVAAGALVVDADLLAALDQGHLEGAILDVFREEPLPAQHPFWHHPGVLVTPHVPAPTQVDPPARPVAHNPLRPARDTPLAGRARRAGPRSREAQRAPKSP